MYPCPPSLFAGVPCACNRKINRPTATKQPTPSIKPLHACSALTAARNIRCDGLHTAARGSYLLLSRWLFTRTRSRFWQGCPCAYNTRKTRVRRFGSGICRTLEGGWMDVSRSIVTTTWDGRINTIADDDCVVFDQGKIGPSS